MFALYEIGLSVQVSRSAKITFPATVTVPALSLVRPAGFEHAFMRAWNFRTDTYYELLSKKQAVAQGWAKASDDIVGVRIYAVPIPKATRGIFYNGVFSSGFDWYSSPDTRDLDKFFA